MTILAAKTCVTCTKPCYPTERLMVSDLWVHKAGCMKCSACSATLSLNSVYVAPSPSDPSRKLLWCAKDVPKMVHTSVVDSIALKTAMNAPKCTSTPTAVFAKSKSQGKTLRFKGLTLRSKSIALGLNAPKPEYSNGRQQAQQIFVGHVGAGLDAWDIAHAMAVQSQIRSPIRSHDAIRAQYTGSSTVHALSPNATGGSSAASNEVQDMASAKTGEEGIAIEPDLVRNLIRVFQLDSIDAVEVSQADDPSEDDNLVVPEVIFDVADHDAEEDVFQSGSSKAEGADKVSTNMTPADSNDTLLAALPGTIGRSAFYSTLRPSSSTLFALPANSVYSNDSVKRLASVRSISSISAASGASECGTFRANGMGSFRSTLTMRTLGTIGSKRGTLTLARIKGTLRRPALSGVFATQDVKVNVEDASGEGAKAEEVGEEGLIDGLLDVKAVPNVPANTPIKSPYTHASRPMVPRTDSQTGTLKGRFASIREDGPAKEAYAGSVRGISLLKALLPLTAHLVPLPNEADDDTLSQHNDERGYFDDVNVDTYASQQVDHKGGGADVEQALLNGLEMGGLELIMMFEEEAEPLPVSSGIFL